MFTRDNYLSPTNRTTLVNIRGGSLMSQVFAGGRGRSVRECADSKSLGGVYGNSCLIIDRPVMHYPYWDDATKEYLSPNDDANNANTYTATSITRIPLQYSKLSDFFVFATCTSTTTPLSWNASMAAARTAQCMATPC